MQVERRARDFAENIFTLIQIKIAPVIANQFLCYSCLFLISRVHSQDQISV